MKIMMKRRSCFQRIILTGSESTEDVAEIYKAGTQIFQSN
jgi:hypothetical protein